MEVRRKEGRLYYKSDSAIIEYYINTLGETEINLIYPRVIRLRGKVRRAIKKHAVRYFKKKKS